MKYKRELAVFTLFMEKMKGRHFYDNIESEIIFY